MRTLEQEPDYFDEESGKLKIPYILNKSSENDSNLLSVLLRNTSICDVFVPEIDGYRVFLREKFELFLERMEYDSQYGFTSFSGTKKPTLTIGNNPLRKRGEVVLTWPYQELHLEGGQSKQDVNRDELFFHEILAHSEITQLLEPKVLTNGIRFDSEGGNSITDFTRDPDVNSNRGLPEDTITDNLVIRFIIS